MSKILLVPNQQILAADWNNNFNDLYADNLTITYNTDGNVDTVSNDDTGEVLTFHYDGDGKVSTVTSATGDTWTFTYNSDGNISTVVKS